MMICFDAINMYIYSGFSSDRTNLSPFTINMYNYKSVLFLNKITRTASLKINICRSAQHQHVHSKNKFLFYKG